MEQVKVKWCEVIILSMTGELICGDEEGQLEGEIEDLLAGKYVVLAGHPESFETQRGQYILNELSRLGLIVMIIIDEVHVNLHWNFRPTMQVTCRSLRAFATPDSPLLLMTATMRVGDMRRVARSLDVRSSPVVIHSSPVHEHMKLSVVTRPSNAYGFDGLTKGSKPGLLQLLHRVYFKHFFDDVAAGRRPKKVIIFFRGFPKMLECYKYLVKTCGQGTADVANFVMVHADLSAVTEKVIVERLNEYSVILATARLLLGVNIENVDMVIFVQPFGEVEALVQGLAFGILEIFLRGIVWEGRLIY